MIPLFNAIVLDVAVVAIIVIILVASITKGIMHTLINFVLLAGSVALGFAPFMSFIKNPIIELLSSKIVLGVGIADEMKLGLYLLYPFIASFALSLIIYLILRLIKLLMFTLLKRNAIKANKLPKRITKLSRALGGVAGFILYGAVVIFALSIFSKPLVGGEKTLEKGYVAKYIEQADDLVAGLLVDEEDYTKFEGKLLVKLLLGDLYSKTPDQSVEDIDALGNMISDKVLVIENLDNIKEKVTYLHHFLRFINTHALDDKGLEIDGFEKVIEQSRALVTKVVNEMNTLHGEGAQPIDAGDITLAVSKEIKKLGLSELIPIFEKVFVIN